MILYLEFFKFGFKFENLYSNYANVRNFELCETNKIMKKI